MDEVINLIIALMEEAEKMNGLSGAAKKDYVTQMIKVVIVEKWGEEYYQTKIKPLVPTLIEFIISMSKNEIILDVNKQLKKCCWK